MKKIYIFITLILLAIIAITVILNYQDKTPVVISDKSCSFDDDCIIVAPFDSSSNNCCETCGAEVISKQAEIKRSEWYAENCSGVACTMYDCYSIKLPKPKCIDNQCEIEWVERPSVE